MFQPAKPVLLVSLLLGVCIAPANAAEREDVRKAINLITSVKMPYPENLTRNRARTERVWLEREGATTGCIRLDERRWCYEHIRPQGNRAEMLRIRDEPSSGVHIGAFYYYVVDYDLDGLIDVGGGSAASHAYCACHRVFLPQHKARRTVPGQLSEDVRRGRRNRSEVFWRITCAGFPQQT